MGIDGLEGRRREGQEVAGKRIRRCRNGREGTTEMTRTRATTALRQAGVRARVLGDDERGDVPGWVLITLMTAGLVIIIWGLAGPALSGVFQQAIDRVTSF